MILNDAQQTAVDKLLADAASAKDGKIVTIPPGVPIPDFLRRMAAYGNENNLRFMANTTVGGILIVATPIR